MAKTRVCAYCRVSTKEEEQFSSFQNQISYFEREFGNHEDYELVEIYRDRGKSGTSLTRPGFDKMIADAGVDKTQVDGDLFRIVGKPKFNRILVKNTSRFARNVSVDMLLKTLRKNGVYVDYVDLKKTTENAEDMLYIQMFATIDEEESRNKSTRVLFGIQEGIKRGNIHSHGNLYGYKYYPKPENRLEIIEEEAKVVRLIFDLYASKNMGVHRIRQHLIEQGIFARSGKPFSERGLRVMIQNEHYSGRAVRHKFTNGLIFDKHPTKETGEAIIFDTDKVPAIVDIETFEKAQKVLESRVQHTTQKGIYRGKTDFAGKIVCGCCGAPYYASSSDIIKSAGGRVRSYACKTKRTMHRDADGNRVMLCNNPNVSETQLKGLTNSMAYWGMIWVRVKQGIKELKDIRTVLESRIDKQSADEVKNAEEQRAEVQQKINRLLDLYESSMFTIEQLEMRVKPLRDEEAEINARIKALSKSNDDIRQDIAEVDETLAFLMEQDKNCNNRLNNSKLYQPPEKEQIIEGIERIIVEPDGHLTVKLKAYEEIGRLLSKHRHLLNEQQGQRKVS